MRSLPLKAATFLILAGAWACGDDGGGGPGDPVANFTAPTCTAGTACTFTDQSTGTVTGWSWNFGDNTAADPNQNPSHIFQAPGTYTVVLTVTGNNKTSTKSVPVTIGGGTGNQAPVASFSLVTPPTCTAGTPCGFHSTSTDADGTIATAHWDFGDGEVGDGLDATHTFATANTYNVKLTVTDNLGAIGEVTQPITVVAATSQDCTTNGTTVDCVLTMTQRSTITIAVVSRSCELGGNRLSITAPRVQTAFFNLCSETIGNQYLVKDANGAAIVFDVGSQLPLRFTQGVADAGDPTPGDPGIEVEVTSPTVWTLKIDDGGNPSGGGEPDFNDAVLSVTATAAP